MDKNIQLVDGVYVDMLIEQVLSAIEDKRYDDPALDEAFTLIVRRYIAPEMPDMLITATLNDSDHNPMPLVFLNMLTMDYQVAQKGSDNWPPNGFPGKNTAIIAVSIYRGDEEWTDFFPGDGITQAALGALIQVAREIAHESYNQLELFEGEGYAH